jgi:hypothetical protein
MALRGTAALAMWWDVAADVRAEFEHWHSHEHFPERLALPGFLRATRWSDARGGEGIFVMYELAAHDVLSSPAYVARLNAPTLWSKRMMPHHRGMVRTQCRVLESRGIAVARHAATVRLAPRNATGAARLRAHLAALHGALVMQPGLTGAHLLQHVAPALAQTTEQKIRGGDAAADWIVVMTGYDPAALEALFEGELGDGALAAAGASAATQRGLYALSASGVPGDLD